MFLGFSALHHFTKLDTFGPLKDILITAVLTSGLFSAWSLGGVEAMKRQTWITCLAVNLLFRFSIQDLRDVTGDAAARRRTTPLLVDKTYGTCATKLL